MTTWNEYKESVKKNGGEAAKIIEDVEAKSAIVTAIIQQRDMLGLTQRDIAAMCNIPQSTLARIESNKTSPNIDTILKILQALGLTLKVSKTNESYAQ